MLMKVGAMVERIGFSTEGAKCKSLGQRPRGSTPKLGSAEGAKSDPACSFRAFSAKNHSRVYTWAGGPGFTFRAFGANDVDSTHFRER
jgi:hypothetical protein